MKITAGPYLQNVDKDRITVMWHTEEPGSSVVDYEANTRLGYSYYAGKPVPSFPLHTECDKPTTIHAITLTGLEEGREYFYRVSSVASDGKSCVSEEASFCTAPCDTASFSFATYGDSMIEHDIHARIAELVRRQRPDIIVNAGDIVLDTIERCADDFFEPASELLRYTPWFACMGNHDSNTEVYNQFFHNPEPRYWYSFNYGCTHFIVLNSCMDYSIGSEQYEWLRNDLAMFRDARWKFVFFHHPPYCSNNCEIEQIRVLCPLFEEAKVDIVYNAHATHYERFHPIKDGRYDPEGVVYVLTGGGGCDPAADYAQAWDHVHPFSAAVKGHWNFFISTHVTPNDVTIRTYGVDGALFDSFTVQKQQGDPLPHLDSPSPYFPFPDRPEEGTVVAGFAEIPARWLLPRPQFSLDSEISHSGHTSIRLESPGSGVVCPAVRRVLVDDGCAMGQLGGKAFTVSAWVKTEGIRGGVFVSANWNSNDGNNGRVAGPMMSGTNDWQKIRLDVPPLPADVYGIRLLLSAENSTTGTAWFDDILMR